MNKVARVGNRVLPIVVDNGRKQNILAMDMDVYTRRPPSSETTMADSNIAAANYPAHPSKLPDTPLTAPATPLRTLLDYHRSSISTTRTSLTDSSLDEPLIPLPRARPRASYKLVDFIIQRTLGTGSFGRVHLGQFFVSK